MVRLKWWGWLLLGVALMGGVGYLVAALLLFPAPLLPNEREVARVTGLGETEAQRELTRQDLVVAVTREPHPTAPSGAVVWQDPPAGVAVPRGAEVRLTVSSGRSLVAVPDVYGLDYGMAMRFLGLAGLRVDQTDSVDTKEVPHGYALGTSPEAGDSLTMGRGVVLRVARGNESEP